VIGVFPKMSPPIDVFLLMVVPSEIGQFIAVMKFELWARVRCISRIPANSHRRIVTLDPPPRYREVSP
jgi:hypothetical protein